MRVTASRPVIERTERAPARWICGLGLVTLFAVASAAVASSPGRPRRPVSPVVYPDQSLPLRFSHVSHLEDLDCVSCHVTAAASRSAVDNLLPGESACTECHEIDRSQPERAVDEGDPPARCDACHLGYQPGDRVIARLKIVPPNIKFSHQQHLAESSDCGLCHGDFSAEKVELATREQLPAMSLCLGCHDGKRASAACTACHLARGGGVIETEFAAGKLMPSGSLRGADHDLGFRTRHKQAAENDPRYCNNCHRKSMCVECHNGVIKPMDFHGNDYLTLHAIDARRNIPDCGTCHRSQSFCVGCHSRAGVAADQRGSEYIPRSSGDLTRMYHPGGWVGFDDEGPHQDGARPEEHHSFHAQRNIRQCVSCHREEFCQRCHSAQTSSYRVSPHPRNWRNSRRCESLAARNGRLCLRCHVEASEVRCDYLPMMR